MKVKMERNYADLYNEKYYIDIILKEFEDFKTNKNFYFIYEIEVSDSKINILFKYNYFLPAVENKFNEIHVEIFLPVDDFFKPYYNVYYSGPDNSKPKFHLRQKLDEELDLDFILIKIAKEIKEQIIKDLDEKDIDDTDYHNYFEEKEERYAW